MYSLLLDIELLVFIGQQKDPQKEADGDLNQILVPDLVKVLSKCAKEKTDGEGQPLYIDDSIVWYDQVQMVFQF